MKTLFKTLAASIFFLVINTTNAQAYNVELVWNDFDASIHDGVWVDQFIGNQLGSSTTQNCHGYAYWMAYGIPTPVSDNLVPQAYVKTLINDGDLVHLGVNPSTEATHVLYYVAPSGGSSFDAINDPLWHSVIMSQFDCLPYDGQTYVQGANGMLPSVVTVHRVNDYNPMLIPHYFKYIPASGATLIPVDYQPSCPPSVLICSAIQTSAVTCHDGSDGAAGVLHSTDAASTQSYSWNTGATTPIISGLTAGTYTVTVTESPTNEVCISSVVIVNPSLNVGSVTTTGHDGTFCNTSPWGWVYGTGTATVNLVNIGSYTFQWGTHNQTSQTAVNLCSGWHNVTVTNTNTGCIEGYSCFVANVPGKGVRRLIGESTEIYPNPSKGKFTIETQEAVQAHVVIMDASGRIVLDESYEDSFFNADISNYGAGVYIIKMIIGAEIITERMIVE